MTATSLPKRTTGLNALFKPLAEHEILVEGEVVLYKERKHWFSITKPAFTAVVLVISLAIIAFELVPTTETGFAFAGFTFVFAAWFLHDKLKDWSKPALYVLVALGFFAITGAGIKSLAVIGMFLVVFKLGFELIGRAFYRTIYLTNRRIVMAESPWSRDISSVSLGRITDISVRQTATGGLMNYSHLRVETAGQDQALNRIEFIKYADEFYNSLIKLSTNEVDFEKYFEV